MPQPGEPLRLLIIEDRPDDATLMHREVTRAGLQADVEVVADEVGLLAHLSPPPDLILADFNLPGFSALRVLEVLRERGLDVPVVVVSGSISEEVAVECMVRGATDYILKDRPARLGQAAVRALSESQLRRDKRLAEESLRRSEERFRLMAENARDVIFRYRVYPEPAFEYVSPAVTSVVGYTPEEHYADPHLDEKIVHPSDLALLQGLFTTPGRGSQPVSVRWRHKDGHVVWIEQTSVPVYDEDGRFVAIEGISRDVSERHLSEQALRLSETRFRGVFAASPIGIAVVGAGGRVTEMNAACADLLGIGAGRVPADLVLPPEFVPENVSEGLAAGQSVRVELPVDLALLAARSGYEPRRTGSVNLDVLVTPLLTDGDASVLVQLQDITEKRRLEAQLLRSQRMETIGLLAGGIAHDFNNLLTAITGYATFAKSSLAEEDPSGADLAEVLKASERASSLTRQLLAFARDQSRQVTLLDANELLRDMDRMLRRLIREDIELVCLPADSVWPVEADRGQLEQVLANLVINARDAMPSGGKLTIETRDTWLWRASPERRLGAPPGEYVVLSVSDTGQGISPEASEHLFEPFFTTKPPGQGTGLGLAVVYSLVQQHRGDIRVRSQQGHGSTFDVYLPRALDATTAAVASADNGTLRGTETVLLAEDEPLVRGVVSRILHNLGYRVLVAEDGEEAMRVADEWAGRIDVLLTDVVMPKMSGTELAERLRRTHPDLKVMFASGYNDTQEALCRRGLLTSFIQKPFTAASLSQELRRLLDD